MSFLPPDHPGDLHARVAAALDVALDDYAPTVQRLDQAFVDARMPRWPSSLLQLDHRCGGFYGVTAIAAPPKVGKSTLAFASAIEAAASGEWHVIYVNAELTELEMQERFNRYASAGGVSHSDANPRDAVDHLPVIHAMRGMGPPELQARVQENLEFGSERRVLIVLDSISTLVELAGGSYFHTLNGFAMWLSLACRLTNGDVSALIVSEANRQGTVKGLKLEYSSSMVLTMKQTARAENWVTMDVRYARQGGEGPLAGKFFRFWDRALFEPDPEQRQGNLRVVEDPL